ncbi:hypothetical protein M407DRAFT_241698 [Tulasnella calospora MUT 4182]|uniref:Uncharacterized protein n=1 Tax=Tulasnella calospora MUT 4182 TaxID=1051891 RepID=A0A0C3QIE5_9AGAM|nr:hypothetical protein M407DRAFT_241698 [Tulasnella calospora MUT 4182]
MSAESKLFTTITLDNIREVLSPLRKANVPFYIITAESGYCPACHSDLSSANITAPNSLLGHLRRSKKCIAKREERGVKLFGLKQPDSLLWGSVDDLTALDARRFPDRNVWVQGVFPPTRPQMTTPMYASISQWHARTESGDGYTSSSPPPSSGSSDDGWASSSSSSSSPSSAHFSQQYILPPHNGVPAYQLYDPNGRRESAATITPADYYNKGQPVAYQPGQPAFGVPMTTGAVPPQQYQLPQGVQYQQVPQGMYVNTQQQQPPMYNPAYQYPARNAPQQGYTW